MDRPRRRAAAEEAHRRIRHLPQGDATSGGAARNAPAAAAARSRPRGRASRGCCCAPTPAVVRLAGRAQAEAGPHCTLYPVPCASLAGRKLKQGKMAADAVTLSYGDRERYVKGLSQLPRAARLSSCASFASTWSCAASTRAGSGALPCPAAHGRGPTPQLVRVFYLVQYSADRTEFCCRCRFRILRCSSSISPSAPLGLGAKPCFCRSSCVAVCASTEVRCTLQGRSLALLLRC